MNVQFAYHSNMSQAAVLSPMSSHCGLPCPSRYHGFSSWQELARLVWECDISSFSLLEAFQNWKKRDGTKSGLLMLPKRPEFTAKRGTEQRATRELAFKS